MAEVGTLKITLDDVVEKLMRDGLPRAFGDVIAERSRQLYAKGYTHEHDDQHDRGEIAAAGAALTCAALAEYDRETRDFWEGTGRALWPGDWRPMLPRGPRADLVRAAALLIAEVERLDRLSDASTASTATSQTTSSPT